MATMSNQAEILRSNAGHRYGDINIYGNALLGDGVMTVQSASVDPQEQQRQMLMDSLDYEGSGAKRDQLRLTDIGTPSFAWVKDTPLPEWFRHGKSAFWISGKPGSGKSTLMRYLVDSHSTQELLNSEGHHWKILHFFYDYRAGHGLGNVPCGMLRTFLLQLLRSLPSMTEKLNDRRFYQQLHNGDADAFIDILAELVRSTDTRICAFIDGLDEYDGRLWELCSHLELLRDRTGMKMCLASRPELELVNAFSGLPTIVIQEHNDRSIQYYINRRVLEKSSTYPDIRSAFSQKLALSLREKARGVILWAKLVVNEMLEAYDHETTENTLSALLGSMPPEIGQLYDRLVARLPDAYKGDAILVLNLVTAHENEAPLKADVLFEAISFVFGVQSSHPFFAQKAKPATIESTVKGNLSGLLDFVSVKDVPTVRLIHETLATHLRRSSYMSDSLPSCARRYFGPTAWARLLLDTLRSAVDDSAFEVTVLSQKVMEFLQARVKHQGYDFSLLPLDSVAAFIRSSRWRILSHFLVDCLSHLCRLLRSHLELARDSFETTKMVLSSDVGILLLRRYVSESQWIFLGSQGHLDPATLIRLWTTGRLDLAISAVEGMTLYLCEAMERSQLEPRLRRDVFDLVVTNQKVHVPTADLLHFAEHPAMRNVHLDGRHICRIHNFGYVALRNIQQLLNNLPVEHSWSEAHDPECKYYDTPKTLMVHWCESYLWSLKHLRELRSVILSTGVNDHIEDGDSSMEAIFDVALKQWKERPVKGILEFVPEVVEVCLSLKMALLIEHEEQIPSRRHLKSALRRAVAFRRRLTLGGAIPKFMRGENRDSLVGQLESIIPVLRKLATKDSFSKLELQVLREDLLRVRSIL